MELKDVLDALENLKVELEAIKSANDNVERAVTAAAGVSKGFEVCGKRLQNVGEKMQSLVNAIAESQARFDADCIEPLRGKVAELVSAGNDLQKASGEIEASFSKSCSTTSQKFQQSIGETCADLNRRIDEFHKELDAFGKQIGRMTERIESQNTDINEKISGLDDFVRIEFSQKIETKIESAQKNLSDKIDKLSVKMSSRFDEVITVVRAAGDAVSKTVAEKLASEVVARLNTLKIFLVITTILSIAMLGILGYIAFKP